MQRFRSVTDEFEVSTIDASLGKNCLAQRRIKKCPSIYCFSCDHRGRIVVKLQVLVTCNVTIQIIESTSLILKQAPEHARRRIFTVGVLLGCIVEQAYVTAFIPLSILHTSIIVGVQFQCLKLNNEILNQVTYFVYMKKLRKI